MNLWPRELFEFRERHLRSDAHRLILAIGLVEQQVQERYGIDPTQSDVPEDIQKFAFLALSELYAENDTQEKLLQDAIAALLAERLSS